MDVDSELSALHGAQSGPEIRLKPTPGLEPGTPSLRVTFSRFTDVHERPRVGTKYLLILASRVYDRATSRAPEMKLVDAQWTPLVCLASAVCSHF